MTVPPAIHFGEYQTGHQLNGRIAHAWPLLYFGMDLQSLSRVGKETRSTFLETPGPP